jgi:hypothetical protein
MKVEQFAYALALAALVLAAGCGGCAQKEPQPTTTAVADEMFAQRHQLDRLYLTEKTFQKVIRPGNVSAPFVDEATGEFCWPALICLNPDCPGQGELPYLFIHSDPLVTLSANSEPVYPDVGPGQDYAQMVLDAGGFPDPTCPACYKAFRQGKSETAAEKSRYLSYVTEYELPESAQLRIALERSAKPAPAPPAWESHFSGTAPGDASPEEKQQRAVELASQIKRPILRGGVAPETAKFLRQALAESEDPEARAAIIAGLAKARDADSMPQLLDAMEDESLEVRKIAGEAVERTCGFPRMFQADAPPQARHDVIARYRENWDQIVNAPDQHFYRLMTDPGYKADVSRRSMEKLKQLRAMQK